MDYKDLKETIGTCSQKALEQRRTWYSPAAEAYNKARPHYPQALIHQVVAITHLSSSSKILEVGCGPATATISFAQIDASIVCLEPNPNFFRLAQKNCHSYLNVAIQNTSFEEWSLEAEAFDAVLAASSFHWIPSEVGYPKAAKALRESGYLILLWNKELQPSYEAYQELSKIYQAHAPSLVDQYQDRATQENILQGLGQIVLDSGCFKNLEFGFIESEVMYTSNEYLALLSTYSPYLQLNSKSKEALFEALKDKIESDFSGRIQLSYISAFHIAQKC